MTNKRGTVKLFTFSFEIDAPNIISCAPKIFSCVPKNLHLVAQVLPNSNLNFEPCVSRSTWGPTALAQFVNCMNYEKHKLPRECPFFSYGFKRDRVGDRQKEQSLLLPQQTFTIVRDVMQPN